MANSNNFTSRRERRRVSESSIQDFVDIAANSSDIFNISPSENLSRKDMRLARSRAVSVDNISTETYNNSFIDESTSSLSNEIPITRRSQRKETKYLDTLQPEIPASDMYPIVVEDNDVNSSLTENNTIPEPEKFSRLSVVKNSNTDNAIITTTVPVITDYSQTSNMDINSAVNNNTSDTGVGNLLPLKALSVVEIEPLGFEIIAKSKEKNRLWEVVILGAALLMSITGIILFLFSQR